MADLLVRDLSPDTIERLKERARQHGRSLQGEVKAILEASATLTPEEARQVAAMWHRRLAGQAYTDSADDQREGRER